MLYNVRDNILSEEICELYYNCKGIKIKIFLCGNRYSRVIFFCRRVYSGNFFLYNIILVLIFINKI